MKAGFNKLWKPLTDSNFWEKDSTTEVCVSFNDIDKMGKDEDVLTELLVDTCAGFLCNKENVFNLVPAGSEVYF